LFVQEKPELFHEIVEEMKVFQKLVREKFSSKIVTSILQESYKKSADAREKASIRCGKVSIAYTKAVIIMQTLNEIFNK
jgi:glutamyl-tRNA reductase